MFFKNYGDRSLIGLKSLTVNQMDASSNLVDHPIFACLYRRGSGNDCKSFVVRLGWFDSIGRHQFYLAVGQFGRPPDLGSGPQKDMQVQILSARPSL
jgi:hypothetical protein